VANGHIDDAVELAEKWSRDQPIPGLKIEVVRIEGRTPVLLFELAGDAPGTILMYGHLDKQPEMTGWRDGYGPWTPVLHEGKLYGRGGADDGYAIFASLLALQALKEQGIPHARIVGLIETCEESGSYDLPHYLDAMKSRVGDVDLVIGLDSGCGNYEQLWVTTSLRGMAAGTLTVEVLNEGVHSGDASGIVPSSFRIVRLLLDRLEEASTRAGNTCRQDTRRSIADAFSVCRQHGTDDEQSRSGGAQSHLATVPVGGRCKWFAGNQGCRQRVATEDRTETQSATTSPGRWSTGH
jgi:acetylornithine deacetylase/succinyl-diaminopimelate desuccinylase-like protein